MDIMVNVVYDKIFFNIYDVYNMKNGFFIVLFGGLYVFFWMSLVVEMLKFNVELFVNGERKGLVKCDYELG